MTATRALRKQTLENLSAFPLKLIETSLMGRGLQVTRSMRFGEVIFDDEPFLILEKGMESMPPVNTLSDEVKELIMQFSPPPPFPVEMAEHLGVSEEVLADPILSRVFNNKFNHHIYELGSFVNHSCYPNMVINKESFEFIAARDIDEGEELFICYNDSNLSQWGIKCGNNSTRCNCFQTFAADPNNIEKQLEGYLYFLLTFYACDGEVPDVEDWFAAIYHEDMRVFYDQGRMRAWEHGWSKDLTFFDDGTSRKEFQDHILEIRDLFVSMVCHKLDLELVPNS